MSKVNELINKLCPNGVVFKNVGDMCNVYTGGETPTDLIKEKVPRDDYIYPVYSNGIGSNALYGYAKTYRIKDDAVTFSSIGTLGHPEIRKGNFTPIIRLKVLVPIDLKQLSIGYLKYALETAEFDNNKSSLPNLNANMLKNIVIPIPPLEVQEEIVRILDKFGELEARKSQYEFWREKLLNTGNSNKQYITLGDVGKLCMCKRIMKNETSGSGDVPFYKIGTFGKQADAYISYDIFNDYKKRFSYPKKGEILVSCSGTIGRSVVFDGEDAYFQDSNIVWLSNDESKVLNKFLYYFYQTSPWNISDGGTIKRLYNNQFISAKVPLYSLEEQKKIVDILERFDKLINDITVGLPAEIELRRKQYEYYRNKLLSFEELSVSE